MTAKRAGVIVVYKGRTYLLSVFEVNRLVSIQMAYLLIIEIRAEHLPGQIAVLEIDEELLRRRD